MTRSGHTFTILLGASLGAAACTDTIEPSAAPDAPDAPAASDTGGGTGDTFNHDNTSISVWNLLDRLTKQGPPSFTSHMHGCAKVRYATLGKLLASVGVNVNVEVDANAASDKNRSAGALYKTGAAALGAPNYGSRVRENLAITTSGASRLFDIFAAAAGEIIAALPNLARCQINGIGPTLFDEHNACHAEGITCLIGTPGQPGHVELCNLTVARASSPEVGKRMAVAALMAAAYTCE